MTELADYEVVLVGCGQMGSALIEGAVGSGAVEGSKVVCLDVEQSRARELAARIGGTPRMPESRRPRMWIYAVKPDGLEAAMAEHRYGDADVIVSVAAGVSLEAIRRGAGPEPCVVRAMPNTPSLVGQGVTGYMADPGAPTDALETFFGAVGIAVRLKKERDFDALTAISGSGPAYVFLALEALADGGVLMGLDRATARTLAAATVRGAAALALHDPEVHTAELKDRVSSPGGITIEALASLERAGFRSALIEAVRGAAQRSHGMSK